MRWLCCVRKELGRGALRAVCMCHSGHLAGLALPGTQHATRCVTRCLLVRRESRVMLTGGMVTVAALALRFRTRSPNSTGATAGTWHSSSTHMGTCVARLPLYYLPEKQSPRLAPLHRQVTNPVKQGEGVAAFVSYSVRTKTTHREYAQPFAEVGRRFRDFAWLHDKLAEKNKVGAPCVCLQLQPLRSVTRAVQVHLRTGCVGGTAAWVNGKLAQACRWLGVRMQGW